MAQFRQSGSDRAAVRGYDANHGNGVSDYVSIGVRSTPLKQHRNRRLRSRKLSIGAVIVILCLGFVVSVLVFMRFSGDGDIDDFDGQDDDSKIDSDFLTNVTRIQKSKVLEFGHGSEIHGRDSRYWDKDDRRRDDDYSEDVSEQVNVGARDESANRLNAQRKRKNVDKKYPLDGSKGAGGRGVGLYNEAGRNELKSYEAEYEASLKTAGGSREGNNIENHHHNNEFMELKNDEIDVNDEHDDDNDGLMDEYEDVDNEDFELSNSLNADRRESLDVTDIVTKRQDTEVEQASHDNHEEDIFVSSDHVDRINRKIRFPGGQSSKKSTPEKHSGPRKKSKRRKFSGSCEMKLLNSTTHLVEPLESRKFARFSLQYTEFDEKPGGREQWEPKFAGHQNLEQREESFLAQDQKINCGFVKSSKLSSSTGFDLAEDDAKYISSCHIAVVSCIFGNSDRLRSPTGKTVSRLSRKNVCFVMFMDEVTLRTISSEGQMPDTTGFVGLWKIVVVKNLPYTDMRRVGKIPKLLAHRLFPSARYSIWLDSKLRLQHDPLLILEYFLWRKGYEYGISNHYDRHCVWEEVAQNKRLNKYNHTVIDEQFEFYQADGLKRFDASDPNKLLPSNVPEGSFIVRAHTPMSNLFSCLWFNEVERFTPRDQLSFAYTYHKLRRTNPSKPFQLNMFKDCERRTITKLYRHRSEESRKSARNATDDVTSL